MKGRGTNFALFALPESALWVLFAVLLLSSIGSLASAVDSDWTQMVPTPSPSARLGHSMAYVSLTDRVILLGGETAPSSNVLINDTWAYDVNSDRWENRDPSPRPSARFAQAMAYDGGSERTLLFGGWTGTTQSRETWAYDYNTNTWTDMASSPSPPAGVFVAMVYDVESDRTILFGGSTDRSDFSIYSAETWAYDCDSNLWTRMNPAVSPSARVTNGMMAYDVQSDRVVLFGGRDATGNFADTWEYDYDHDTWMQTTPASGPAARHAGTMAYDSRIDKVVLFGGYTANGISGETWVYDADRDAWAQTSGGAGPSARFGAAMMEDTESGRLIVFGGSSGGDETWLLRLGILPPAVVITSPQAGATLPSATITVTGTASDDVAVAKVEVGLDNATWIVATGTTAWSATLTLGEGANTIYVRVTDNAGNTATTRLDVTVAPFPDWLWPVVAFGIGGAGTVAYLILRRRRKAVSETRSAPK